MRIYATNNTETDSVEMLLNYQELKILVSSLSKLENEVKKFKGENREKKDLGFTHLHLRDCGLGNNNLDVVFYIDLSE